MYSTLFYFFLSAAALLFSIGGLLLVFTVSGAIAGALGWALRKVVPSLLPLSWKQAKENKFWTAVGVLCGVIVQILIITLFLASRAGIGKPLAALLSFPGLCSTLLTFVLWAIYGIASIRADPRTTPPPAPVETEFAGDYRSANVQRQPASPSKPTTTEGAEDLDRACSLLGALGVVLSTPYVTFCCVLVPAGRIHLLSFFDEPGLLVSILMLAASWVLLTLRTSIRRSSEGRLSRGRVLRDVVFCLFVVCSIAFAVSTAPVPGHVWTLAVAATGAVFGVAFTVATVGFVRLFRNSSRTSS